ncbi:replication protein A 70 kDa DNA-binding subunit C-like [Pyrus ussuriensis x Pyrus communis]|uniref:Replication protein A 70 kDa DNA-binding subunit C-like n=1 Tax=Pyrus ussuriensis x Pyrus communis TaxID=2448454 RepID=A0A5N5HRN2_9ROSA|nr:replication protein A 70 kDa DNA-binding subunit C-like [Pyrus ussuriensis x Pyrus communis]
MEDEGPTPLDQLMAYKKFVKIKVRVYRIWRPKYPGMGDKYTGLHCILIDEKISDHFLIKLCLSAYCTTFFLQAYNILYPRLNKLDILTDVIGYLVAVQPLKPIQINKRIDHKCDLVMQNISHILYLKIQANEEEILQTGKNVTIEELRMIRFLCKVSIKQYNMRYKVFFVLEDETNETNALIIGKSGEKVFGMPHKDLVFNQKSAYQKQLPLRLIGQRKFFNLRFGNRRN